MWSFIKLCMFTCVKILRKNKSDKTRDESVHLGETLIRLGLCQTLTFILLIGFFSGKKNLGLTLKWGCRVKRNLVSQNLYLTSFERIGDNDFTIYSPPHPP